MRGVGCKFSASGAYGRAEIYIDRGEQAENKYVFDQLLAQREALENAFGGPMVWERLDHRRACRIKCETEANMFEREDWPRMIEFMTDAMVRMEKAFHDPLQKLNADVRSRTFELEDDGDGL